MVFASEFEDLHFCLYSYVICYINYDLFCLLEYATRRPLYMFRVFDVGTGRQSFTAD